MAAKKATKKAPAKKAGDFEIEACITRHCKGLDDPTRATLLLSLRSIPIFVRKLADESMLEKDRKRQLEKVRTNAVRLVTALDELDEEARLYAAYCMTGGDPGAEQNYDRTVAELRSLSSLIETKNHLRALATAKESGLPFRWKERPELLIAADLITALSSADVSVVESNTGVAAECFYAIAYVAGIETSDDARYWIKKALASPYV